jgi:putative CocE/NonD family hydrolase
MRRLVALLVGVALPVASLPAQDVSKYGREGLEQALAQDADARLGVMVPMRDGVRLSTEIFRPRGASGKLPTILLKTPYDEHPLSASTLRYAVEAVRHGYAFIVQNERGRYFSEGKWEILGHPQTDGYDALTWIAAQPWSNGKVGTLGCSSSAEWQLALAAQHHPAHKAMVPMSAGAGIGTVGPFHEQGNWYTGGVPRSLFFVWLYGVDNPLRAQLPAGLSEATQARLERYNDLAAHKPSVDWTKQIRHLPVSEMMSSLGEPPATFDQFIQRTPDDPAWRTGGLWQEGMGWGVPALWFNTWYDVSIGPNLALFNHIRGLTSDPEASANQYAVVAPVAHCQYAKLGPNTVVGERDMGDTSFDVDGTIFAWFDRWLKDDKAAFPDTIPHLRYYEMGANQWRSAAQWPPAGTGTMRLYLRSGGDANSLYGDGRLTAQAPAANEPADKYVYDPLNPVPTMGGGDCCNGGLVVPGAVDQRPVEARKDVLVYTSDPLDRPLDVAGFVDAVLKVSSDAKDSDFAVKLVDVAPDGTAWIIGDTIFRARYRDGYDRQVMMAPGRVYTIHPTPIATSIQFGKSHRIRVEVTSSDFPKFERNLNTGGPNETESKAVVAASAIHHDSGNLSYIDLPVQR